jgi:hypothetical protein
MNSPSGSSALLKNSTSAVTKRPGPGAPVSTVTTPPPMALSSGQAAAPWSSSSWSLAVHEPGTDVSYLAPRGRIVTTRVTAGGFASGSSGLT